jgi:uncharacterized protein YggE
MVVKRSLIKTSFIAAIALTGLLPTTTAAQTYSNDTFWGTQHAKPDSFTVTSTGEAYGTTTTGIAFRQVNVVTDSDVRLQRFQIQEAYFYVSDRGIIRADNSTQALSMYIARG